MRKHAKFETAPAAGLARRIAAASLLLSGIVIAGCSGLGIGEEEFTCKTTDAGQPCSSSWDVYKATNDGKNPSRDARAKRVAAAGGEEQKHDEGLLKNGRSDFVLDNYVTNRLPDEPVPVRTPPQVMRIWVAPYEDTEGDFIVSGYVYSEISPRRWTLGVNNEKSMNTNLYQPLARQQ